MKRSAVFTKAETRIAKLLENYRWKVSSAENAIAKAEALIEKAEAEAAELLTAGQLAEEIEEAQHKNEELAEKQKEIRTAQEYRETCGRILDNLQKNPIIGEEEYKQLTAEIMEEMNAQNQKAKEQIVELCDKILAIGQDDEDFINRGNALLEQLQSDLYRDKDRRRLKNGDFSPWDGTKKEYTDHSVTTFTNNIGSAFVTIGGVKPEQSAKTLNFK